MAEQDWRLTSGGVEVAEFPVWTWVLRLGEPPAPALEALLGTALPAAPLAAIGQCPRLLWLAPGEWAILSPSEDTGLTTRIEAACAGALAHVANLMRGWAAFALTGDGARDLLAKGCSLDFHPRAFADDSCARTLFGQVPVTIERSADTFRLYVDRSLAAYMRHWLAVSAGQKPSQ